MADKNDPHKEICPNQQIQNLVDLLEEEEDQSVRFACCGEGCCDHPMRDQPCVNPTIRMDILRARANVYDQLTYLAHLLTRNGYTEFNLNYSLEFVDGNDPWFGGTSCIEIEFHRSLHNG